MLSKIRLVVLVSALALAISVLGTESAFAKGKSNPTLTVSPSSATPYSVVQISGCGYTVGSPTELVFQTPTATSFAGVPVDGSGCIATSVYVYGAGSYTVQIFQDPNARWTLSASSSLTVQ